MSFSEKPDEKETNNEENNSIDDNNIKNQNKIIKKIVHYNITNFYFIV